MVKQDIHVHTVVLCVVSDRSDQRSEIRDQAKVPYPRPPSTIQYQIPDTRYQPAGGRRRRMYYTVLYSTLAVGRPVVAIFHSLMDVDGGMAAWRHGVTPTWSQGSPSRGAEQDSDDTGDGGDGGDGGDAGDGGGGC